MGMRSGKALKLTKVPAGKAAARPTAAPADRNRALRALAQRIVDCTVANDEAGMLALYDPRIESQEATMPPVVGLAALREKFAYWNSLVSDGAFLPRRVAADGRTIMIEWDGRVTLRASGRVVEMREVAVHEIAGGRIVRERFYYDPALLQG